MAHCIVNRHKRTSQAAQHRFGAASTRAAAQLPLQLQRQRGLHVPGGVRAVVPIGYRVQADP